MRKKVLLLGAAQHQIFTLKSVKDLGCIVIITDQNPDSPGFKYADFYEVVDIKDIANTLKVAKKYDIDAIIPLSDYGVQTAAAISEELGLLGLPQKIAKNVTSKAQMRKIWEEKNVPSAKFRVVDNLTDAYKAVEELNTWPLIFKPADSRGGGSRGVLRVNSIEEVKDALNYAQSFYSDKLVVIEEYLDGLEHSMEIIVYNNTIHVLAISDKEKLPPPFRVDKSVIYPTILSGAPLENLISTAKDAVKALDINIGAVHVEMCTTKNGPRLFEIGARFGGGHTPNPILPFLTGFNVVQEVVKIFLGEEPLPFPTHLSDKGCVYRFLTPSPGILKSVIGLRKVRNIKGILDSGLWVKPGDIIHPIKRGGDRAGYIVAGMPTRAEAIKLADYAESNIIFNIDSIN